MSVSGTNDQAGNAADLGTIKTAVRLSVALNRLRSRLREESGMSRTGLTTSQLAIVQRVIDNGPLTAAALASLEHVSAQAVAQNLAGLKSEGLVEAQRDPGDRRKTLISATPLGRRLLDSLFRSREAWLMHAIDALVAPEHRANLEHAIDLLEDLADAVLEPEKLVKRTPPGDVERAHRDYPAHDPV